MQYRIKKVAVLGSGVMGSGIACQLANVGLEVLILDILPQGTSDNKTNRNSVAQNALNKAIKSKPAPLYKKQYASRITVGNFEDDFEKIRELFDDLERKQDIANFLNLTEKGDGVRVFIGSENKLFSLSGSSLIISPYMNSEHKIIGAVGVIGPTRLNYGKIVPIVDYTAQLVGKTLLERG